MHFTVIKSAEELKRFFDEFDHAAAERVAERHEAGRSYWSGDEFNQPSVDGIRHTSRKSGAA